MIDIIYNYIKTRSFSSSPPGLKGGGLLKLKGAVGSHNNRYHYELLSELGYLKFAQKKSLEFFRF